MSAASVSPGVWSAIKTGDGYDVDGPLADGTGFTKEDAELMAASKHLLAFAHFARAFIGTHTPPHDCYDYDQPGRCGACDLILAYDSAIAKVNGGAS